jgi:hypothetical protein
VQRKSNVIDETENATDDCVAKCKQEHEEYTSAQLLDKLATMLSLNQLQVEEKFGHLLHAGLVIELCHQICVPSYGASLVVGKTKDDGGAPDLTLDP